MSYQIVRKPDASGMGSASNGCCLQIQYHRRFNSRKAFDVPQDHCFTFASGEPTQCSPQHLLCLPGSHYALWTGSGICPICGECGNAPLSPVIIIANVDGHPIEPGFDLPRTFGAVPKQLEEDVLRCILRVFHSPEQAAGSPQNHLPMRGYQGVKIFLAAVAQPNRQC